MKAQLVRGLQPGTLGVLSTPLNKTLYLPCFPSGVGSFRWKQLVLAGLTGATTRKPHFFYTVLHEHNVSVYVESAEVIGRSSNVFRFLIVRNPYERLLSLYVHKFYMAKKPHLFLHGAPVKANFSTFVHHLARVPTNKRHQDLQPVVRSHRTCMLADPKVLRIELINQWYPMLVSMLELREASRMVALWGRERCFYRPCNASCAMASRPVFSECWGGSFPEPFAVDRLAMRLHYADEYTVHRASRIVEDDLLAFGYPYMYLPPSKSSRAAERNNRRTRGQRPRRLGGRASG
ncbi:MAG: sulfotransferase family 2 domain-containing protein [Actinomycetales bacterium]|tara:strand:- start:109 stop:981 length:873 start_codon:yes stop_codon:yes gene_type:complete